VTIAEDLMRSPGRSVGISCHALKFGGGMERYAMDLVDGLRALGIRPTVFAKSFDEQLPQFGMIDAERINVGWLPGKLRDHAFAALLQGRRTRAGTDLLIACNRVLDAEVAVCGGTHPGFLRAMQRVPRFFDRRMIELERRYMAAARVVVAHSRLMEEELIEFSLASREKIRVIYPPVAAERFRPVDADTRSALRRSLGLAEDRVVFAFPSSSHERKGFPLLRRFFEDTELPVTLAVAGRPVPSGLRNILYLGFRKDVERVYQAADFTVLASRYEPFGLVGVESVLCGTPVLLASNIGCSEIIDAAAKEEFAANDGAALDAAVRRAVARVTAGRGRLDQPAAHLGYPVDVVNHVRALLAAAGWRA
jgi:glycosyltransferase involved in cell wall biosynthesis